MEELELGRGPNYGVATSWGGARTYGVATSLGGVRTYGVAIVCSTACSKRKSYRRQRKLLVVEYLVIRSFPSPDRYLPRH